MNSDPTLLDQQDRSGSSISGLRVSEAPRDGIAVRRSLNAINSSITGERETATKKKFLPKARWYLSRLAAMQLPELLWRARSAAKIPINWIRWKVQPSAPTARWSEFRQELYPVRLHAAGPAIRGIRIFDLEFPTNVDFDWHRDYRYDRQVGRRFADVLDIRDTHVVGDIKYVWEPSRHQHLSALAFSEDGQEHAVYILRTLDSWLRENAFLSGVHWTSSLELGERLVSWSLLYPRIADKLRHDDDFRCRWLNSIYHHLHRISEKLSLHSSANNHLVGELTGLYIGSTCFNFWPECREWRAKAKQLLEREIQLQVGEDGVNREQAMSYQLFTMQLFLLAFIVGSKSDDPFNPEYAQRLRAMAHFIDAVATDSGDLPWYGDSDEARGFVFSEDESGLEVTMQLAALLFHEPRWLRFRREPTAASRALLPELLGDFDSSKGSEAPARELFPDAGLACVRSCDRSICLLMDFGPLGYPRPAAHGHADALSVWLSIDDEYFLIDAGTYAYHSHPDWREFFRGTSAHNTARVDGTNQSEMSGRFLWSAQAKARLLKFDSGAEQVTIEAEHDGYTRLADPVVHKRCVSFDRSSGRVSIEDHFACSSRHQVELFFHLHEEASVVSVCDGEANVVWRRRNISFSSPDRSAAWQVASGSENPKLGWRSRHFNQKQPIPSLRMSAEIDGPTTIRTLVRV